MIKHKHITAICVAVTIIMLITTVLFMLSESFGVVSERREMPYVESLFSTDRVHTLDIVVEESDWQGMLDNAMNEEYISCNVVIDGNAVNNVGIRPKGNSSLSTMVSSDSDRYSFKIEFDHYSSGQSYKGLDKVALNNIIQDNSYLKDYVSYQLMNEFSAYAPLCSFINITLNGEPWGLYLAAECIEDSFAERNFGTDHGNIYKPDSNNIGGGEMRPENMPQQMQDGGFQIPDDIADMIANGEIELPDEIAQIAENTDQAVDLVGQQNEQQDENAQDGARQNMRPGNLMGGGFFGGMGNSATKLAYSDDSYDSYSSIFDNSVFDVNDSDKDRLIRTLKQLSEGENLEEIIDVEEVLRYFVVHNYLLNFDSYTGSIIHNYYLYENDGQLSMIAWDYNLAFGSFGGMGGGKGGMQNPNASGADTNSTQIDQATQYANYPIDTPVSGGTLKDRPLLGKLLENEEYLELYHELFQEFIEELFDSGKCKKILEDAIELISPYVEEDPTAFCTYEEFLEASETLVEFAEVRAEGVRRQLNGTVPATTDGQSEDSSNFVDASDIDIESTGSMGGGGGGFGGGDMRNRDNANFQAPPGAAVLDAQAQGPTQENENQTTGGGNNQEAAKAVNMNRFNPIEGEIPQENQSSSISVYLPLALSFILLLVGLVVAKVFKVHS